MRGALRRSRGTARRGWLRPALLLGLVFAVCAAGVPLPAQDDSAAKRFAAESLGYRTNLHEDPLLDPPLEALVKLYIGAERAEELVALYRTHLSQYPEDAGAKTVLVRILRRLDRSRAEEFLATAVARHPDYAPLHYLLFRSLDERGDPRAAETLSRAIDLESSPARRRLWLEQLMQIAEGEAERALARAQIEKAIDAEGISEDEALSLARLLQSYRFWETSVKALNRTKAGTSDPEAGIEIEMMLATAMAQLGNQADAGGMLDGLLRRLSPDHWRRREILSLRVSVLADETQRNELLGTLEAAWRGNPGSEAAATDYASTLAASERREDALAVLMETSRRLPESSLLESRSLELLDAVEDRERLVGYLAERLESQPGRADLRLRLAKVEYSLGRDADAEQDFRAVVAGLSQEEASSRILELQRHLREIGRIDAAEPYLEGYLRNHPTRLDVARELFEIRLSAERGGDLWSVAKLLAPEESEVENLVDLAEFLLSENQGAIARILVEAKLAVEPRNFELGLLHAEILGVVGDVGASSSLSGLREAADTLPRYRRWLDTAISAHRRMDSLAGFLEGELNRYQFEEDVWSEEKVERFAALCEAGRRDLPASRIAEGLRRQVERTGLEPSLRLRLRKALASALESDPATAPEAERQLQELAVGDPGNRAAYDLRRALVYWRSQREALAQELLAGVSFDAVDSPPLLREAAEALEAFGMLSKAAEALDWLTRLEPDDFLGWERRLSVLAALGDEATLRSILRKLRDGGGGPELRENSRRELGDHLVASYWRSIAARLQGGGNVAEALPLLESLESEGLPPPARLWADWTRSRVLSLLGRSEEAREAAKRFANRAAEEGVEEVSFPDGLVLSAAASASLLEKGTKAAASPAAVPVELFVASPVLSWIYELPKDARLLRMALGEGSLLLLDESGGVQSVEPDTGKLLWRRNLGSSPYLSGTTRPSAFDAVPMPPVLARREDERVALAKAAPSFAVEGDRFLLLEGDRLTARSVADGTIRWVAPLPETEPGHPSAAVGARPGRVFSVEDGVVVVYDVDASELRAFSVRNGKLLWVRQGADVGGPAGEGIHSLNAGLEIFEGLGIAYGRNSIVFDLAAGAPIWSFEAGDSASFPLVLRPPRPGEEGESIEVGPKEAPRKLYGLSLSRGPEGFLRRNSSIVGPAVKWAEDRHHVEEPAAAHLADGFLWLLGDESVRRISLDLPMASRDLPAAGALLGSVGDHIWFLDGAELVHGDFRKGRTTRIPLGETGEVTASLSGFRILVRGSQTLRIFNAQTGAPLGQAPLPETLLDYLAEAPAEPGAASPHAWQGRIARRAAGRSAFCLPTDDLVREGRYFTVFRDRFVVCLEAAAAVREGAENLGAATPAEEPSVR